MLDLTQTIATLVLDHSELAPVLQRHRLDFCCRGNMTLAAACAEKGLDVETVGAELTRAVAERGAQASPDHNPREESTQALIERIVATHHAYLREVLPFVQRTAAKVARVHGEHNPRLVPLNDAVQSLCAALLPHLDAEEQVLFPAMIAPTPDRAVIEGALASMQSDHLEVGDLMAKIRTETEDFTLPVWACNSYRALFSELVNLETDILTHVHLENHVLMPRYA